MPPRITSAGRALFFLSSLTGITVGHAQALTYGVDAGVGETDNVTLAHDNKISQTIAVTDVDVDYKEKSRLFDADAKGNFSYLDYLQDAYHNQVLGRFDGTADVALIPQRLTWVVKEDFGQAAIDPFTPTVPTNLENINYLAIGPDLHLRPDGASFVDLTARAARTQYSISPFANTRATGSLAWGLNLSPLSSVSLNGDTERVLFDNTVLNTNFERSNAFVRYALSSARSDVSADLGATIVAEGGVSTTSGLAKFKLARQISAATRVTVGVGHEIIDGSTSFSSPQAGAVGVVGTAAATNTSENYTSDYGSVGWDYRRYRTTFGVTGRWEKDRYPGQPALDRTMVTGGLRLRRQLTRAFALQVSDALYRSDYGNAIVTAGNGSPNTTTNLISAAVTWRHGRALEVKLACEHSTYTTSPTDTGYRENRVFLTVGYRPFRGSPVVEEVPGI